MNRLRGFPFHSSWTWLWLTWALLSTTTTTLATTPAAIPTAKPGCPTHCGNVTIRYPFGINRDGSCSFSDSYSINCNASYDPPKPFVDHSNLEIVDISDTQVRIKNILAVKCYQRNEKVSDDYYGRVNLLGSPFVFSDTANKLTVVGCDDDGAAIGRFRGRHGASACKPTCYERGEDIINGSCNGVGCCQISIPKGLKSYTVSLVRVDNHTKISHFNHCNYAFLAEQGKFKFSAADIIDPTFENRTMENVPIVLDWFVGDDETCQQAQENASSYACKENTDCTDIDMLRRHYYRCSCSSGYLGNPYLKHGCTDIDECAGPDNPCSNMCTNLPGSYQCSCPKDHRGDGLKKGTGCIGNNLEFVTKVSLGTSFALLLLLTFVSWIYIITKRKNLKKNREKFFEQNGGILLKQQLSAIGGTNNSGKIFNEKELRVATNNYSEDRILGKGGYGTVFKGMLKDGREVAIKKSMIADENQIEQFINEVVILTQINHRNVVKLLGCCLETEVPQLVYEFISNGTLFEHIHRNAGESWLTLANCVRLATEAANALAYLHSAASIPIIHRDVKSPNILVDSNLTAKMADFGASRLVPIDQTRVTTLVQGTLGYLDPEYFLTSQLTEKSDVYSFGVVLAELMTKEKPLCRLRKMEEINLATYFVSSMKEDRLFEILDPQLVKEATSDELVTMANLVKKCVNVKGEDRPTMKEVALELEGLKKQIRHRCADQNYEQMTSFTEDVSPVTSDCYTDNPSTTELSGPGTCSVQTTE